MLGKYLSDKKIPWHRRRRLGIAVAGKTPTDSFLTKIGKMQSAECRLCRIAAEARGESTDGLVDETHGHINSAGCKGMATTVTAAHHSIWRHLYDNMYAAHKPKIKLKFVTLDKESNMSTLWRREEFLRIYTKEDLTEKAQDIEVTIPVKKSQEARYKLDPDSFFINRFWGRRPDGVALNEALKIGYILECKRSTDRDEGFLEVKDAEGNEQHKSIISVLKAAAPEWEFEQINFVVGNRGSVVESDFYSKLKKLDVQEGGKDKLFADHVTQVCKAHYRVIVSSSSRCKEVRGQPQRDRGRTLGTMCTCEEIERGTHACRASRLGPVERWWTQDGKLGIIIQDPPPESGRRTHLLYFTDSYCILSRV